MRSIIHSHHGRETTDALCGCRGIGKTQVWIQRRLGAIDGRGREGVAGIFDLSSCAMSILQVTRALRPSSKLVEYDGFIAFHFSCFWSIGYIYDWWLAPGGKRRWKTHPHALIEHLQCDLEVLYGGPALFGPHIDRLQSQTCVQSACCACMIMPLNAPLLILRIIHVPEPSM